MPARKRTGAKSPRAYGVKVTLLGVRPPVWRRVQVRSDITLDRFHQVLQTVMGWTDSHMHQFSAHGPRRGVHRRWQPIERDEESRTRLMDLLGKPKERILYEYDFGDGWEHEVLLEKIDDHEPGACYPWILDGRRACPPDDVGGVPGYEHFLRVLGDARHPEHEEMLEWCGGSFDAAAFDVQAANRAFHGGWAAKRPDG